MSRKIKELLEKEVKSRYGAYDGAVVVDVSKLTGVQANQLRGKLRGKGIELHVVKNRAAKRVFAGTPLEAVGKNLKGPCALVTGKEGPIAIAKELVGLVAKDYPAIILKGGVIDGEAEFLTVEKVSKRRGRMEILGDLAAAISAPGRKVAGALGSPAGKAVGCLKAIIDKLEKGEQITRVA